MAPSPDPTPIHVLVCCFGLWGESKHLHALTDLILEQWKQRESTKTSNPSEFKLLIPDVNASMKTLDGVDLCASRLRQSVLDCIVDLEADGHRVTRFSMLGYSLGGLVARYLATLLLPELKQRNIELINFITVASPAVGIPLYNTFKSSFFRALGSRLLSRSGKQLYAKDQWADTGKPLLENMTEGIFLQAMQSFQRVEIYAAAINDQTVPFPTAALSKRDPFAGALQRAQRAKASREPNANDKINIEEGGLAVLKDLKYPALLKEWHEVPSPERPKDTQRHKSRLPGIPWIFRPSSYPWWPKPLRYLVALGFPVVFPFLVLLVISKSYLESLKSAHRIKVLLLDPQHSERIVAESFIERATHTLEEVMENNMAQSPSHASTPASSGASTPQGAKVSMYGSRDALRRQKEDDDLQPQWTGAQLRMLDNLATVDKMNKHFAWFPDILTGHGTIICRAPMFGDEGRPVIQHLADHFVF